MKKKLHLILLLLLFIIGCQADLQTKRWAMKTLKSRPTIQLVKGCVDLTYTENDAMVMGLMKNAPLKIRRPLVIVPHIIGTLFLLVFIWFQRRQSIFILLPLILILSGAVGNFIDKIRFGFVVDFIHIYAGSWLDWPYIFNIADALICVGGAILLLQMLWKRDLHFIPEKAKGSPIPDEQTDLGEDGDSIEQKIE